MSGEDDDVQSFYDEYGKRLGLTGDYEHLDPVLPDVSGKRVLDAGCGLGNGSQFLASRGASVTGIDISKAEISTARERHGAAIEFHQMDLREPLETFDDGAFDIIVCALTLAHLLDWNHLFTEFHRIVSERGSVVVHAHHPFVDYLELDADYSEHVVDNGATYAKTELFDRPWGPNGQPLGFYRRPLGELLRPGLDAGFVLDDFVEPGSGPHESDRYDPSHPPRHLLFRFRSLDIQ